MPDVVVEKIRRAVSLVTLNRPDRLNALTVDAVLQVHRALDEVARDGECRVVILTGAGRGFCAGLDLKGPALFPAPRSWGPCRPA